MRTDSCAAPISAGHPGDYLKLLLSRINLRANQELANTRQVREAKELFELYDEDASGTIDNEELKMMIENNFAFVEGELTEKQVSSSKWNPTFEHR